MPTDQWSFDPLSTLLAVGAVCLFGIAAWGWARVRARRGE